MGRELFKFTPSSFLTKKISFFLFIILLSLFYGCNSEKSKIKIGEIQDVQLKNFDGKTATVILDVPLKNERIFDLDITKIDLNAKYRDTDIGEVSNMDTLTIPKKSEKVHQVKLKVEIGGLFGSFNVMNVLKNKEGMLHLKGDIQVHYFLIFNKNRKYEN